jgi:DNA-binding beta-propeller fold protein YncE
MRGSRVTVAVILSLFAVLGLGTAAVIAAPVSPGDILVVEQGGGTIRHYSASGADLGAFASGLSAPSFITADDAGNIYVSEFGGNRVVKFSSTGLSLLTITTPFAPGGLQVSGDGTIYVADYFGHAVRRYSALGVDLGLFVSLPDLLRADFIAFDASGYLYVTDFLSHVIRRISPAGADFGNFIIVNYGLVEGIAFDSTGNLYVAVDVPEGVPIEAQTGIIKKYSASGAELGAFASTGLFAPLGLSFDSAGNLYAANYASGTIEKFALTGADLGIFQSGLNTPRDLVVVPAGGPTTKDQCTNGGWNAFQFPRTFKNQGDCIQFVNTGK